MKYLKLTDEEYKKASGVIDMLQNQGIGELVEVPDNPQKDNIVEPMILKCRGNDYEVVELEKNGTSNLFFVHELVAATWVPNPQNLPYVRHKNGNTLDNRADNLEWTSDPEAK